MRKLILVAALLAVGCSKSPAASWKVETELKQGEKSRIDLKAIAPEPLLTVGGSWEFKTSGVIALGGDKWTFAPPDVNVDAQPFILNDISFPDPSNGWIAADRGCVLNSSDGGKTWQQKRRGRIYEHLHGIFFTDARTGCVAGPNGLFRTSDGGATWSQVVNQDLMDVCFSDTEHGFAVGNHPAAYQSDNGGASWRPLVLPGHRTYDWLVSVRFSDPQHGWIVGYNDGQQLRTIQSGDGAIVYRTTNGGLDWQRLGGELPVRVNDVWFQDPKRGWICGEAQAGNYEGVIYETTDAGEHWTKVPVQMKGLPTCLNGGWGCTDRGEILRLAR